MTDVNSCGWVLGPGVGHVDLISNVLATTFLLTFPPLSFISSTFPHQHLLSSPHLVRTSTKCARTHKQLPPGFVLITNGVTKTASVGNQSCCQLGSCGSWHRLLCVLWCRLNVHSEPNVYLCRISLDRLHTQHKAILIWPLQATHTHTHFISLFSSSSTEALKDC